MSQEIRQSHRRISANLLTHTLNRPLKIGLAIPILVQELSKVRQLIDKKQQESESKYQALGFLQEAFRWLDNVVTPVEESSSFSKSYPDGKGRF